VTPPAAAVCVEPEVVDRGRSWELVLRCVVLPCRTQSPAARPVPLALVLDTGATGVFIPRHALPGLGPLRGGPEVHGPGGRLRSADFTAHVLVGGVVLTVEAAAVDGAVGGRVIGVIGTSLLRALTFDGTRARAALAPDARSLRYLQLHEHLAGLPYLPAPPLSCGCLEALAEAPRRSYART
jgi:hypothetical protein